MRSQKSKIGQVSTLKKARFFFESIMVRLGLIILPAIPRRIIRELARLTGQIAYMFSGKLRKITQTNLDIAFGNTLTLAEKKHIGRQTFCTTALVILDLFWFARHTESRIRKYVSLDSSINTYLTQTPVIGITAHFGNWELFSRATAINGFEHMVVIAQLANRDVDMIFNKIRHMPNVKAVHKHGAIRKLLKALRSKKRIALLLDQNIKPEEGGVFVNFFGLPATVSNAAAVLSERTGAPIVMLFSKVCTDGTYHLYALPPLKPEATLLKEKDASGITMAIVNSLEHEIRKHPEQWLWMYKRWKYIAPGSRKKDYPFYSKELT